MDEPGKILVIDDCKDNMPLLFNILEAEGIVSFFAKNAIKASEISAEKHPDLILITDPRKMGGDALVSRLKTDLTTKRIPIIAILPESNGLQSTLVELGVIDFIVSPFETSKLVRRIKRHIEVIKMRKKIDELRAENAELRRIMENSQ